MGVEFRVADLIVSALKNHGVSRVFGVVGGNAMHLNDAVRTAGVDFIPFHNEQAAAIAAEAHARITGDLAVCLVTSGPGASNTTTGVAGMFLDSAPVLVISGQAKSSELVTSEMSKGVRQVGTFELPMLAILQSITKRVHRLKADENVPKIVEELIHECLAGRPGPVFLEVPLDVQGALVNFSTPITGYSESISGLEQENVNLFIANFLSELTKSRKPLLIAGHGIRISKQVSQFFNLASSLGIPVVTTQIAKDIFDYENSLFVGHIGIRGDRPGNFALQEADLILTMGTSLQQQTTGYEIDQFAPKAKLFIVDYEGSVTSKNLPLQIAGSVNVDCENFISALTLMLDSFSEERDYSKWINLNLERKRKFSVSNEPHNFETTRLNMYELVFAMNETFNKNETFVSDAGLCYYVLGQALHLGKNQRYLVSGGLGSMGWALPASIGAHFANNGPIICVTGDGSMQMCVQELATLAAQNLNCKIFVINNNGYASIRNTQKSFFSEAYVGCDENSGLRMPNWREVSRAYGIDYFLINRRDQLSENMIAIEAHVGPVLIEVLSQEVQQVMPTIASVRNPDGTLKSNPLNKMSPDLSYLSPELHYN